MVNDEQARSGMVLRGGVREVDGCGSVYVSIGTTGPNKNMTLHGFVAVW